ncbi:uncharacterized protein TRIADDRAFT_53970 [Trichoplax adhaerens]|uniref:Uncharacterized protein n=1 Tax=Trichoplax adhaerens TaxID=10228 RepID=B3RMJ5_TRIAD|nr:hypothetical protein TRIADDRAFT_53970 [Trichoplax adhaerens]EDV27859.1 hypothetical protein TRIADDRAFT_53970 [Trichoplax adhaerens]|eukprot:XP_002109693.1 hypothetical protein TRIADDRAFT_53970 [Trichoplax adhaerens]
MDDDEELGNEWGISSSYVSASSKPAKAVVKETKVVSSVNQLPMRNDKKSSSSDSGPSSSRSENSQKSTDQNNKNSKGGDQDRKTAIQAIVILDSDEEVDEKIQVVENLSDKKSDQKRPSHHTKRGDGGIFEPLKLQSDVAHDENTVKLFSDIDSDSTLSVEDSEDLKSTKHEHVEGHSKESQDEMSQTQIKIKPAAETALDHLSIPKENNNNNSNLSPLKDKPVSDVNQQPRKTERAKNDLSKLLHNSNSSVLKHDNRSHSNIYSTSNDKPVKSPITHDRNSDQNTSLRSFNLDHDIPSTCAIDSPVRSRDGKDDNYNLPGIDSISSLPSCSTVMDKVPENLLNYKNDDVTGARKMEAFSPLHSETSHGEYLGMSTLNGEKDIENDPEASEINQLDYTRKMESVDMFATNAKKDTQKRKRKRIDNAQPSNSKMQRQEIIQEKRKAKSRKEVEKKVAKLNTMEHCIELMSVQADRRLLEVDGGEEIWNCLKKSKAHCKIADNDVKNTVLWKCESIGVFENDDKVKVNHTATETEDIMVYITCLNFLQKVTNEYYVMLC